MDLRELLDLLYLSFVDVPLVLYLLLHKIKFLILPLDLEAKFVLLLAQDGKKQGFLLVQSS